MELRVHNLSLSTATKTLVDDVSFHVPRNSTLAIIGPSGSGKTTLVRGIMGIADELIQSGHARRGDGNRHTMRFGYIPQDMSLWPHLSVKQTLELAVHFSRRANAHQNARTSVMPLMHECGLMHVQDRLPKFLSGGEKKRLALARALVTAPDVLILDEPFSALDVIAKGELIALIIKLKNDVGFSMIFISHDLAETFALGDHIMVMDSGRAHWLGPKHELTTDRFLPKWNPLASPLVHLHHLNHATEDRS